MHTLKLPYGFRVECETVTDKDAGTVTCNALAYEGSHLFCEHVFTASATEFETIGDLIRVRGKWLDDVVHMIEGGVRYLIASRDCDRVNWDVR